MSEKSPVQLFKPSYRIDECLAGIRECLELGWTGLGFKTVQFENEWKGYTGHTHAHFLNSATAGLYLALEILKEENDWKDDAEIITTSLTFVSTNHAILINRLKPTFADVDQYLCLAPDSIESHIGPKTKAVMFVGIGGNTGHYQKVVEICRKHNLILILDAAHMSGTRLEGKTPGLNADVTVYSFQAVKNLPTADSGMICFREGKYDEIARKKCWLGINKDTFSRSSGQGAYKWMYDVEYVGHKYHGNSIMAAIGLTQLKYLDQDNAYRRQICEWYATALKDLKNLSYIPVGPGCESSRHLFQIVVNNRDELLLALNETGIFPGVHYRDNTEYRMYAFGKKSCPNAENFSKKILSLPLHLNLSKQDVDYVSAAVKQYAR